VSAAQIISTLLRLLSHSPLSMVVVTCLLSIVAAVGVWLRPSVVYRYLLTAVVLYSRDLERRDRAERLLRGDDPGQSVSDKP